MKRVITAPLDQLVGRRPQTASASARHHASRAAHGDRHPLRDAPARGRVAAGASSRPTTTGCTCSSSAARGRGRRRSRRRSWRASWPARSACRCPSSCWSSSTRRSARAEPDPEIQELIAASARAQPRRGLPARARCRTRPTQPAGRRAGGRRGVVRRARDQRRPHAAQPEPAALARPNLWLIDHGAALYVHHGGGDPLGRARAARSRRSATTCCCPPRARSPRPTRGWRRARPAALEAIAALVPAEWAGGAPYAEHLARAAGGAARVGAEEAERVPAGRVEPVPVRERCGSSRASSAARRSTPASCCSAARCASSAPARSSTRRCWPRSRRAATRPRCAPQLRDGRARSRRATPARRRDRGAAAVRALPLADRAGEHDRAAVRSTRASPTTRASSTSCSHARRALVAPAVAIRAASAAVRAGTRALGDPPSRTCPDLTSWIVLPPSTTID